MKVLIINQYASNIKNGFGGRHYYLAKYMSMHGADVQVVAASYTHLLRTPPKLDGSYRIEKIDEHFSFLWLRTNEYSSSNKFSRILNWFIFGLRVLSLSKIKGFQKPDVIVFSSPPLLSFLMAFRLARKYSIPIVWDVRDLWPLTFVELGGYSKWHPFVLMNELLESFALKNSSAVISNWKFSINYYKKKGCVIDKFLWVPNGYDSDEYHNQCRLTDNVLDLIPERKFIVGYVGTIGLANALHVLIDVATELLQHSDIHFVIVGDGYKKDDLISTVSIRHLDNITFVPSVPKKMVSSVLGLFDICYVGFSASNLYSYGFSLTKLPEYLMSAKPIVCSVDSPYRPIEDAAAGLMPPAEDVDSISSAILKIKNMSEIDRVAMGNNGKRFAKSHFCYDILAERMLLFISSIVKSN